MRYFTQLALLITISGTAFHAEALPMEIRAVGAVHEVKAREMNDFFQSQNLKELHKLPGIKVDVGFGPSDRLMFGMRISHHQLHLGDGTGTLPTDTNYSKVVYELFGLYARYYLINSPYFRFDLFGGAGGARGFAQSKSNNVEQKQGLRDSDLRFAQFAGGSLSVGAKSFLIVVEGGYEWARLNSLDYTSNANPRLQSLDFNGPYVAIGVTSARLDKTK